jgi:hypothetical protein
MTTMDDTTSRRGLACYGRGTSARRQGLPALLLCVALTLAIAPAASPQTAATTALAADATQRGVISLLFGGAAGSPVQFYERIGDRLKLLGSARSAPNTVTVLTDATTWSCDRPVRRFEALAIRPDGSRATGTFNVRTASCAQRFVLTTPRRVAAGGLIRVGVRDRWKIGRIATQLCITPPHAAQHCKALRFATAVGSATRKFRAKAKGRWRVELRVRTYRVRASVTVGGGRIADETPPPTVLATGDSTMQGIDSFLAEELGEDATVRSDVRIGTGITRGSYWLGHAQSQVARHRQPVTVISLGGALDAFPMVPVGGSTPVECCDVPWALEYSRRVRTMMQTYLRGGRGRVFWLTPPLPRDATRARVNAAVDAAIVHAAEGLAGVTVVRIDTFFSPNGYSEVMHYRGHDVRVRAADGIHLSVAGTSIVAQLVSPAIRQALKQTGARR